jgi:pantoate--beta-alanine ligase
MRTLRSVPELRTALRPARRAERSIGLVPTMGALHEGHLSLIRRAREECDEVVVSLFVNPTQFGAGEDLDAYPRDEARDAALAAEAGADLLFAPTPQEVYPESFSTTVSVAGVSEGLCGAHRGPEHFSGVATVVAKLLNMVGPDVAFFGQKDAQQAVVIRRLVRDLNLPVRVELCPTVREPDGLALSSRNAYLNPDERRRAAGLYAGLRAAEAAVADGDCDPASVIALARDEIARHSIDPEYLELVSPDTLEPVDVIGSAVLMAVAAQVGRARLIDNLILTPAPAGAATHPHSSDQMGAAEPCSV